MKTRYAPLPRLLAGLLLGAALATAAQADDDAHASKEREALRRAQSALRTMTEERDGLQADKAKLAQDKDRLDRELAAARSGGQAAAAHLQQAEQRAAALQAQFDAAQAAAKAADAAAAQQVAELQGQLQAARRESAERLQTARSLSALLERSTTLLAADEDKNRKLYAIGEDLLKRYQSRPRVDTALLGDPLLGLVDVRYASEAEDIRGKMAQQQIR